uniref:G_PROTEIN_RECEP_F1_2 domain-containing protein n=1 Tax=Macrostomum lignano TaxID=282301 RepID=A0A1I8HI89_9PLAT
CQTACLIAGSWILSAVYSSPVLLWTNVRRHNTFGRQCSIRYGSGMNTTREEKQNFWQIFVTANLVTIIIIPVTMVAVCHIVLIVIIFRSGRGPKMPDGSGAAGGGSERCRKSLNRSSVSNRNTITRAKIKTVKVTCTIVS